MKAASTGKFHRGVSIVEILIALAILTLTVSAVIMVVFGNQSLAVDTQTNIEALAKAQSELEEIRKTAKGNFVDAVTVPTHDWTPLGGLTYTASTSVRDVNKCLKQATSTVSWTMGGRHLDVSLTTFLSDVEEALALGGHCATPPKGKWQTLASVSGGDGSVHATDVYAKDGYAFVSAYSVAAGPAKKPDLLIYSYDPGPPKSVNEHGTLDTADIPALSTSNGLNDLVVVGDYVYAANNQKNQQLVIIDVADVEDPQFVSSVNLPNITSGFTCNNPTNCLPGARSIYYYDGYLYIGTGYLSFGTATENHEFYVYCISDTSVPLCAPTTPVFIGSVNIDHNVNDIVVRDGFAYLATSDDLGELTIVDLSDLSASPVLVNAPGDDNRHGLSLYLIGKKLYLGRVEGSAVKPNFIIYDVTTGGSVSSCGSCAKHLSSGNINAITVFDDTAFLVTEEKLEILNVQNSSDIKNIASLALPKEGTGIDYDSDYLYVPIVDQGAYLLNIYYSGP